MQYNHPLFAEIMDLYFEFFSSEFVKQVDIKHPKRFEYFFSGLYSAAVLNSGSGIDCMIYPSVANQHRSENLAIAPYSSSRLQPVKIQDCIVMDNLNYALPILGNELPTRLHLNREALVFENGRVIWDDD